MRVTLIVNPEAGHGRTRRLAGPIAGELRRLGAEVDVRWTERRRHASELARQAVQNGTSIIAAAGGDGTLNEAVSGLLEEGSWPAGVAIVPLPVGTANSFAREFAVHTGHWQEAIRRMLDGRRRQVDAARASFQDPFGVERSLYFVNMFGTGFIALVAETTNRQFKFLGSLGYSAAVFWQLARLSAPLTRLEMYGPTGAITDCRQLVLVAVSNTQWTGDRMWIAPQADPTDGLLDVLTLTPVSRIELIRLFLRLFSGRHLSHPAVLAYRVQRVTIAPQSPSPLLLDGEVLGSTPVSVSILPGAVTVAL
jgi:diacylglycerol kinase (ATP)